MVTVQLSGFVLRNTLSGSTVFRQLRCLSRILAASKKRASGSTNKSVVRWSKALTTVSRGLNWDNGSPFCNRARVTRPMLAA